MTTIVCNRKGMAADTRVSIEGCVYYHAPKIFKIRNSLFGTAKDGMMCLVIIEWLKTKDRNPLKLYEHWTDETDRSDAWVLELDKNGIYLWDGWGMREQLLDQRYAIGSGSKIAITLLDEGKTLEEAVEGAIKLDQYSGNPIQSEYL